eukprot:gene12709-10892_t
MWPYHPGYPPGYPPHMMMQAVQQMGWRDGATARRYMESVSSEFDRNQAEVHANQVDVGRMQEEAHRMA